MYLASVYIHLNSVEGGVHIFKGKDVKETLLKAINFLIEESYIENPEDWDLIKNPKSVRYINKMGTGKTQDSYTTKEGTLAMNIMEDISTQNINVPEGGSGWMSYTIDPMETFKDTFYILKYNQSPDIGWDTAFETIFTKQDLWGRLTRFTMQDKYGSIEGAPELSPDLDIAVKQLNEFHCEQGDYLGLGLEIEQINLKDIGERYDCKI